MLVGFIFFCLIILYVFYLHLQDSGAGNPGTGNQFSGHTFRPGQGGTFIPPTGAYEYFTSADNSVWIFHKSNNKKFKIYLGNHTKTRDLPAEALRSDRYGTYFTLYGENTASIEQQLDMIFDKNLF